MTTTSSYWFDVALLVVIIAAVMFNLPIFFEAMNKPIAASLEDKTAVVAGGSVERIKTVKTGKDLVSMLVIVDENTPYPRAIKINESPVIIIDASWVANKQSNLSSMFSASGDVKLSTMLDWKVESVTFVDDSTNDYWHYVLKEQ